VLAKPEAAGGTYLVGDAETVTWRDLYLGLAASAGRGAEAFAEAIPAGIAPRGWRERLGALKSSDPVQAVLPWFSPRLKGAVNAALARWQAAPPGNPWALPAAPARPRASLEMTLLFACATKLPHEKAVRALAYRPPVTFADGLRETIAWLALAGYPVTPPAKD
jgi:2-alkyl-3-oxoalkanoate reductase